MFEMLTYNHVRFDLGREDGICFFRDTAVLLGTIKGSDGGVASSVSLHLK